MEELCTRFRVTDQVRDKARELLRLSLVKCSNFGKNEICRAMACLDLASQLVGSAIDAKRAEKHSGAPKQYKLALSAFQTMLGVRRSVTPQELANQLGCVRLVPFVTRTIESYKTLVFANVPLERRDFLSFDPGLLAAVAFHLCGKKEKLKFSKEKILEVAGVSEADFQKVKVSMQELCYSTLGTSKKKKDAADVKQNRQILDVVENERKRKRDVDGENDSGDDFEMDSSVEVPGAKRSKSAIYETWKATVIASSEPPKILTLKTQQSSLMSFFGKKK
eukprot:gnl/Hemi2/21517_TR7162_c0_g1_i1.p1 gnl/Hemi2/21517_TR7162_c0_g1~~gnl/Hemi2/21517_TR7162_c0_g1_i1.p1  ORF type:complete len:278 (+),score=57.94 gnl/Hemi2/21517_TR7162_c0_g1_i1:68-901(+)